MQRLVPRHERVKPIGYFHNTQRALDPFIVQLCYPLPPRPTLSATNAALRYARHVRHDVFSGERMSEERSNQPLPGASVLIVGLTPDVLARVAAVVAPHRLEARMTTLAKLQADTVHFKPLVVLVDAYLYDFDPKSFDKLAWEVGAKLGIVGSAKEAEALLLQMLPASPAMPQPNRNEPKAAAGPREFTTAKYDAKTLNEALERMGAPRPEFTTAKYDAKTLHEALERMGAPHFDPSDDS